MAHFLSIATLVGAFFLASVMRDFHADAIVTSVTCFGYAFPMLLLYWIGDF